MVKISLTPISNSKLGFGVGYECICIDNRLRGTLDFRAKNGFEFNSRFFPEIKEPLISLQGIDKGYDNNSYHLWFATEKERNDYLHKVIEAFEELKQYLKEEYDESKSIILSTYEE